MNPRRRLTIGIVCITAGLLVTYVSPAFVHERALSTTIEHYPMLVLAPTFLGLAVFVVLTTPPPRDPASAKRQRRLLLLLLGVAVLIVLLLALAPFIMGVFYHGPG